MKIPATVITGFLGAGKTTLIRHILENANGRRIALIINEFGDLGIDREIVNGCAIEGCNEDDVVELANGCICCTVADDFLPVMQALLERHNPPQHIIIETSGLALPKPLLKAFNWPEIKTAVSVDGVISVIDGPSLRDGLFDHNHSEGSNDTPHDTPHDTPMSEVFEDQLHAADMVLLNKADQLDGDEADKLIKSLQNKVRPGVHVVATSHGNAPLDVLLGQNAKAEDDLDGRKSHHDDYDDHDHDDFESFVVEFGAIENPDDLEQVLKNVVRDFGVLRVKGFVNVAGKPARHLVQGVGARFSRYYDRPWNGDENRQSRLVIIGQCPMEQKEISHAILDIQVKTESAA